MFQLEDIQSLTDFQRNTRAHIKRLKKTGRPEILTVNGQAEIVVQDAKAYQHMQEQLRAEEDRRAVRRGLADIKAGRVRDMGEVFDELDMKYFGKLVSRNAKP